MPPGKALRVRAPHPHPLAEVEYRSTVASADWEGLRASCLNMASQLACDCAQGLLCASVSPPGRRANGPHPSRVVVGTNCDNT